MNDDIKSHELPEGLVVDTEHLSVVSTVIESGIGRGNVVLVTVAIVEDNSCNAGNLGADVEGIFEGGIPVLALVDTIVVSLSELGLRLASEHTHGELSHWVHGLGEGLDESLGLSGDLTAVVKLGLELLELRLGWELTSQEEPEGSLGKGLVATGGLVALLSDLIEILASVGNTVEVVELRGFVEEAGHASHATDDLTDGHFTELGVTVLLLEVAENLLLVVDGVLNLLLESGGEKSLSGGLYQSYVSIPMVVFCLSMIRSAGVAVAQY